MFRKTSLVSPSFQKIPDKIFFECHGNFSFFKSFQVSRYKFLYFTLSATLFLQIEEGHRKVFPMLILITFLIDVPSALRSLIQSSSILTSV